MGRWEKKNWSTFDNFSTSRNWTKWMKVLLISKSHFWSSRNFLTSFNNSVFDFNDKTSFWVSSICNLRKYFRSKFPPWLDSQFCCYLSILFKLLINRSLIQPQQSSIKFKEEKVSPSAMFRVQLNIDFVCVRLW